jgi:hypothetical protein
MSEEGKEFSAESPASPTSPLKNILIEFHEIYQELEEVGFSERVATQILSNMLIDIILYRSSGDDAQFDIEFEDDEDENDEGDSSDGPDADGEPGVG